MRYERERKAETHDRRTVLELAAAGLLLGACKPRPDPIGPVAAAAPAAGVAGRPDGSAGAQAQDDPRDPPGGTMPMRPLGKTGVKVSLVGIGGFHLGQTKDEDEAIRIVRSGIDRGITFLDNSWDYNGGQSEIRMGKALRDGYRQKAFLMTKLDGRTREAAEGQLEQSLKRLQTDVIDLVQVHEVIRMNDPDRVFAEGGAIEALLAAKKAGKIRFIGFTGHKDPSIHRHMLEMADSHGFTFDTVQMPLNVMDAHFKSFQHEVMPIALQKGMGILGMKSMGDKIILESKAVTPIECLHYTMSLPTSVVITGCDSMKILDQAITAATTFQPLSSEQKAALLERTRPFAMQGKYELFKTADRFDSTAHNPKWLDTSEI